MNNRFRLRALDAESVYMRHNIVTDFLFPFFRHIIIDIVLVSLHLIDLLLGHRQAPCLFYTSVYEEERLSSRRFGSTKSGIAPFYADKVSKIGFQINELYDDEGSLREKVAHVLEIKNATLQNLYHKEPLTVDEVFNKLMEYKEAIAPYVADTFDFMYRAVKEGKNILLEGQLGALKDTDFGIYPMVTSSNTIAGYGAVGGSGIPPYEIKEVITVVKAYSSAVGAGEFVSEIFGEEADELRRRGGDGGEYGATTGRPRRMGWLDLVATRYGCRVQGTTSIAFTVLDALGYLDEIPVCVGYELDGKRIDSFPSTTKLKRAKPILSLIHISLPIEKFSAKIDRRTKRFACFSFINS